MLQMLHLWPLEYLSNLPKSQINKFLTIFNESIKQGDHLFELIMELKNFLLEFYYVRYDFLNEHRTFNLYQTNLLDYLTVNEQFLDCRQVFLIQNFKR